ncbi:hypothetical protein D3C85_1447990 [compost metagenome]
MRRHLAQPLHPRVLDRHSRIEAFGHGVRDHSLALFLEQFDQMLLLFDQAVDAGGFVVEESGNDVLLRNGRKRKIYQNKILIVHILPITNEICR